MHNNTKTKVIDPNKLFERLRIEVIEQLGYDAKNLRPWQTARVHSLALLHLEMDRMTSEALQGRAVDPKAVAVVGEQLERLLNPSFGGYSPEARDREDAFATAELERLFDGVIASREFEAAAAMQREELAAIAAAAVPVTAAPESLVTVTKLDQPPSDNTRTTYVDAEVLAPEPTPAEHPLKHASLGNPNSVPTPPSLKPLSPYDGHQYEDRRDGGIGPLRTGADWSPGRGW